MWFPLPRVCVCVGGVAQGFINAAVYGTNRVVVDHFTTLYYGCVWWGRQAPGVTSPLIPHSPPTDYPSVVTVPTHPSAKPR